MQRRFPRLLRAPQSRSVSPPSKRSSNYLRRSARFERLETRQLLSSQPVLPEWLITAGAAGHDSISNTAVHPSGDLIVTASFSDTVDFDPGPGKAELQSAGGIDVAVARYTPSGELVWARRLGGGVADNDRASDLAVDGDGNVYVVAELHGEYGPVDLGGTQYPADYSDGFLCKLDAQGSVIWTRHFALGNVNWTESLSGVTVDDRDPDPANWSLFVTGSFVGTGQFGTQQFSTNNGRDVFVSKLSAANGDFTWTKIINRASNEFSTAITLAKSNDAALYVLGEYETVVKSKGSSIVTWNNLLTKMDPTTGAAVWSRTVALGAGDGDYALGTGALAANGTHVFVGASFSGTNVDFDPGAGVYNLTSAGDRDNAILALDSSGNFAWAWRRGDTGSDALVDMTVTEAGNVYAVGRIGTTFAHRFGFWAQLNAANGSLVAEHDFPGAGSSLAIDQNDNVYVGGGLHPSKVHLFPTGDRASSVGSFDIELLKFSPNPPPIDPTYRVDLFSVAPKSVLSGDTITMSVNRAHDPDVRIQTINFYRDNGDGIFDPVTDQFIAADNDSTDGWLTAASTAGFSSGDHLYFAQATDSTGVQLAWSSASVDVTQVEVVAYASTNVPKQINDRSTVTSTINVPDSFSILDLDVQLNITHTFNADLTAYLVGPDGTRVQLFAKVGRDSDNFSGTVFDDEAALPINYGAIPAWGPFSGRFRPQASLAAFDGKSAAGTWTLEITDDTRKDTGTLNSWSLHFSRAVTPAPAPPAMAVESQSAEGEATDIATVLDAMSIQQLLSDPQSSWTRKTLRLSFV